MPGWYMVFSTHDGRQITALPHIPIAGVYKAAALWALLPVMAHVRSTYTPVAAVMK